jgi:hypothetical protein
LAAGFVMTEAIFGVNDSPITDQGSRGYGVNCAPVIRQKKVWIVLLKQVFKVERHPQRIARA